MGATQKRWDSAVRKGVSVMIGKIGLSHKDTIIRD